MYLIGNALVALLILLVIFLNKKKFLRIDRFCNIVSLVFNAEYILGKTQVNVNTTYL